MKALPPPGFTGVDRRRANRRGPDLRAASSSNDVRSRSLSRRSANPAGSSRSSTVGSRSGCSHRASRPSDPRLSRSSRHSCDASRIRRGRNWSPTKVPKVCSAGPPPARLRRTVSPKAAALASRPSAACATTSSIQPSISASSVSSRASAACCAGVFSGSNKPPVSASCRASGFVGSIEPSASCIREVSTVIPRA